MHPEAMKAGVKEWVLRTRSEAEKVDLMAQMEEYWRAEGWGDREVEKGREKVRFEVVAPSAGLQ